MQLESAQVELEGDRPETDRQLGLAAEHLQDAVGRLRSTSRGLHPASLSVLGLEAALRSLTEECRGSGCRLRFFFHQVPGDLDLDRALAVFRIAQEAVTNAVRHSGCSEIHVSLSVRDDALHLTVEDDGCGFEWGQAVSEASGEGPLGLLIMRERAVHAGGSLHVDTSPGRGTVVTAEIPLAAPAPPREIRRDGM
jgi:signal transduction histidine kinase